MSITPSGTWTSTGPIQRAPDSWWRRNWKMVAVVVVTLLVVILLAFVTGVVALVMWSFRQSDVFRLALDKARNAPAVVERLGSPIEAGWMVSGSIRLNGDTGSADMHIPIHGPKGKADMYINASKRMGEWTFNSVVVKTVSGEQIWVASPPNRPLPAPQPTQEF